MKNLKDTLSTVCGITFAISTALLTVPGAPKWLSIAAGFGLALSGAIIGILTGKNPNGSTKVIDPSTGQQDINPNATKLSEVPPTPKPDPTPPIIP
jgi:hypothetical protein